MDWPWLITLFIVCAITPMRLFRFLEISKIGADGMRFTPYVALNRKAKLTVFESTS
jgi:hypothetical protein